MPLTESDDGVPGPVKSAIWDAALCEVCRHGYVELDAVMTELDEYDVSREQVRAAIEEGLVRLDWLQAAGDAGDGWLPDVRAFALLDVNRRGAGSPPRVDRTEPPTAAESVAEALA
jgi:hypothetical protein